MGRWRLWWSGIWGFSGPREVGDYGGAKFKDVSHASKDSVMKFRMPTSQNLVPIRVDFEVKGQRFKDAFTWNPSGEEMKFAKVTVRDLNLSSNYERAIVNSIQVLVDREEDQGFQISKRMSLRMMTLMDSKSNSRGPKRCKYGAKTNRLQTQGSLQMEHLASSEDLVNNQDTMLWRGEKLARAVKKEARELPNHNQPLRVQQLPKELIPLTLLEEMMYHILGINQ